MSFNFFKLVVDEDSIEITRYLKRYQKKKTRRSRWCAGNHRGLLLKLNFVAAILDIWRAFLNQFWPNFDAPAMYVCIQEAAPQRKKLRHRGEGVSSDCMGAFKTVKIPTWIRLLHHDGSQGPTVPPVGKIQKFKDLSMGANSGTIYLSHNLSTWKWQCSGWFSEPQF